MLQYVLNGAVEAAVLVGLGLSFMIVFESAGFLNLAHGLAYAWGVYLAVAVLGSGVANPLSLALVSTLGGAAVGASAYYLFLGRFLRRRSNQSTLLLASVAVLFIGEGSLIALTRNDVLFVRSPALTRIVSVLGASAIVAHIFLVILAAACLFAFAWFRSSTDRGLQWRALASNPLAALVAGVRVSAYRGVAFSVSGAVAGVIGFLKVQDGVVPPTVSLSVALQAVVVALIAKAYGLVALVVAALALAAIGSLASWHLGDGWRDLPAYVLLIVILRFSRTHHILLLGGSSVA